MWPLTRYTRSYRLLGPHIPAILNKYSTVIYSCSHTLCFLYILKESCFSLDHTLCIFVAGHRLTTPTLILPLLRWNIIVSFVRIIGYSYCL